jgi:hypothetical protein
LSALRGAATIRGASGAVDPRVLHRVDALLRRPASLVIMLALALLAQSATALADGRDVLADAQDNGRIDGCYSRAELNEALDLARGDQRIYSVTVDLIKGARLTNVARPGVPCGTLPVAAETPVEDDTGASPGIWIGAAVAVGAVAVGAGVWAARVRGGGG